MSGRSDPPRPGTTPKRGVAVRKISLASTRVEIAKGASEIAVDDFVDSHLMERPKTRPELAFTPEEIAELRAPRPEPAPGTPVSRTDVRGLLQKRDERISHLEDELIALRRELEQIRRASRPSAEHGPAAPLPELLDEPVGEAGRDASAWRRVPPPAKPLGGAGAPPRARPSRPGVSERAARDPRAEPDDEPTLEDSGTRLRSEALLDETLKIHTSAHGEPPRAGSSLAPKTDVAAALLGAAAPAAPRPVVLAAAPEPAAAPAAAAPSSAAPVAVDMPAVLSLDVPAVLQFDAPSAPQPLAGDALQADMPAVLQFAPTPDPGPVAASAVGVGAQPHVLAPAEPVAPTQQLAEARPSRGRAPWLLLGGLVTLLVVAGGAVALGWVVLPWAATSDAVEAARETDDAPAEAGGAAVEHAPTVAKAASAAPPVATVTMPSAAAAASVEPAARAEPADAPATPVKDPSLLSFQAYLTVSSAVDAEVVVQGVGVGRTNQKLLVRCGPRNVRLRATGGAWLSEGTHAKLECMHHTALQIAASQP